jgi:hypothetical protein
VTNRTPIAGCSVELPVTAREPFRVYLNGEELAEGEVRREGNRLVFSRPLVPPRSDGFLRWLTMFTAGIGFYGQGDAVDVHYVDAGVGPGVASNLRVHAPGA